MNKRFLFISILIMSFALVLISCGGDTPEPSKPLTGDFTKFIIVNGTESQYTYLTSYSPGNSLKLVYSGSESLVFNWYVGSSSGTPAKTESGQSTTYTLQPSDNGQNITVYYYYNGEQKGFWSSNSWSII